MERKQKPYESPLTGVFEVRHESVICGSGNKRDAKRQDYEYDVW